MKRPITDINFKGYYEVARASDFLMSHGIANEIVRTPIKKAGCCGFTLAVRTDDEERAIKLFLNIK